MKAKDLAALAALGVAGFAAYDKFGKKKDAPASGTRAGAELGKSGSANDGDTGEREARMNMRDMNEGSGRRDAGGSTEDVDRRRSAPERMKDIPESRQERDVPKAVEKSVAKNSDVDARAAYAKLKAAGSNSKTPAAALKASAANDEADATAKSLSSTGGPSRARARTIAAEESDSGSLSSQGGPSRFVRTVPDATPAAPARYNRAADSNAASNAMAASDTSGSLPSQGGPSRYKPSAVAPSPPVSAAAAARQRAIDEKNFDSDLMKGRRQAVVDTLQGIPSSIANIFKPKEKEFQNKTYRDFSGNIVKYAKGGAVKKMASGGMTSSKMSSKPSTASSRGDGIAQRGKTRGQMR